MSAQHFDSSGPAFPVSTTDWRRGHQSGVNEWQFPGMSLRDYFAAHANIGNVDELHGPTGAHLLGRECPLMSADPRGCLQWWADYRAALRYMEADAMLRAREVQS